MSNQQIFKFDGFGLRSITVDGTPWFALKDLCEVLGLGQVAGVKRRLTDDVISNHPIPDAMGRPQETAFVNEDGLYDVILESRKPEARAFRKWVTCDVLPAIRETGIYIHRPQTQLEVLQSSVQLLVEQERRLAAVERRLDDTAEILALHPVEWRKKVNSLINKIANKLGGFEAYQDVRNQSYDLLEDRASCNLAVRLTNIQKRMALEGAARSKINRVSRMDAIAEDGRLTEIYLAIVKELAVKHGIGKEDIA